MTNGLAARRAALAWVLVAVLAGVPAPASGEIINRVLAVVSGKIVMLSDARAAIDLGLVDTAGTADPIAAALERLVDRELMLEAVERYAPREPEPEEIERSVEAARARLGAPRAFTAALEAAGFTETHLRRMIRDDLRIRAYLDQRFTAGAQPTEQEVADYYRAHQLEFVRDGLVAPFEDVEGTVRARLADERRRVLIADWTADLRRRADVRLMYHGQREPGGGTR